MTDSNPDVDALRQELDGPFFNRMLKKWVGRGELDYELYLQTQKLLDLQTPRHERVADEELLFQIVHQAQELWLKLFAHELVESAAELNQGRLWETSSRLERAKRVATALAREIHILETLTPDAYQIIRRNLGDGSGQESPGYNAVRVAAAGLEETFTQLLEREDKSLRQIYERRKDEDGYKRLAEQLVDVDAGFQQWLVSHYLLVRRTIGVDHAVKALDGLPTRVLSGRMTQPLFRALWDVRVEMTASWKRQGGYAPGARRDGAPAAGEANEDVSRRQT
jgi:tryptophan 2,3-dioxygenase